jgi:RNA polymerase sigma-70 factor, ECF subfamily
MTGPTPRCLLAAWTDHEAELRRYLRHRLSVPDDAEDVLQETLLKTLRHGQAFCTVKQPRAWLFQVARHALADRLRWRREHLPLPEDLPAPLVETPLPVERLSQCLPRVLTELSDEDRLALTLCDIEGESQQALAHRLGISLSGAKSRVQRARLRLRKRLVEACQVRFDEEGRICCFTPRNPLS